MTEREKFLADILTTCIEGGSHYWLAAVLEIERGEGLRVLSARLVADDDEDEAVLSHGRTVDLKTIEAGIAKSKDRNVQLGRHVRKAILFADVEEEADLDSSEADCVLQLGLFGEVVYG